jgi:hypothetical protein
MNSSDFLRINEAINLLIDVKNIFRQSTPNFALDEINFQKIKSSLIKLNGIITILNENFGIGSQSEKNYSMDLKKDVGNYFFIVNSQKNRKKLIDIGLDLEQILVTGGPIFENDIKILNPNIPDNALQNIQNKIQKFWKILQNKIQKGKFNKLILLLEENNVADKILLNKKNEFESRLSISVQYITVPSFDQIDNRFLFALKEN